MSEWQAEGLDAVPMRLYWFRGILGPKDPDTNKHPWMHPPGVYRFLFFARDYHQNAERCVYRGVTGRDRGKVFICRFVDWRRDFEPYTRQGQPDEQQQQPAAKADPPAPPDPAPGQGA